MTADLSASEGAPWVLRAYSPAAGWDGTNCACAPDPVEHDRLKLAGWLHQADCPVTEKAKAEAA